jgi:GTP-binding protein
VQIKSAIFKASAPDLKSCPEPKWPELALIGRSNVGKSSLINLLTRKKDLALVSATPGKTKLINFFLVNDAWLLVDLPGYGYAKVALADRAAFDRLISSYLQQRPSLRHVFVLIDSRLNPQAIDLAFLQWLTEIGTPFSVIFTKADKLKPRALQENVETFMNALTFCEKPPQKFISSAKAGTGRAEILAFVGQFSTS